MLLKKYFNSVIKDLASDNFKIHYTIAIRDTPLDGVSIKVLEKTIYFNLDS